MECQAFDYKECMFQITPTKVIPIIVIFIIIVIILYLIYRPSLCKICNLLRGKEKKP